MGGGKIMTVRRLGKVILSQLLCIGSVFTACTDEEVVNQVDKTPLQVSVNTSLTKQSRAIVHGEWLPAGSTIGVSLFTPEGDDYDDQGYYNIQYKGNGEEEDQTWSSMGVTPAVSANEAVLVAYHPYNDDEDLDITAIPVEIATQTDYMYSGLVTGITNAAPKADIVLDHALTAIRVKLVLGDFTGDVSVSEIAVASPALASLATLNAADGSLNNIAGQGDKFTLPVDFGLVVGGTDNDIMFVPDAAVESGVTTVSANIGGKKYTAGIEFDQAYKQGYIYTYTLILNNSGFAVTKVNVNPWETGTDDSAVLTPDMFADALVATFVVPENEGGWEEKIYLCHVYALEYIKAVELDGQIVYNDIQSREAMQGLDAEVKPGKHVARYIFHDMTKVPEYLFKGVYGEWFDGIDSFDEFVNSRMSGMVVDVFPYLTELYIPDSFVGIGNWAFDGCIDLKKIRWSKNLKYLGQSTLNYCAKLSQLDLPETVISVSGELVQGGFQLEGLSNLEFVQVPDNCQISWATINRCNSLKIFESPSTFKTGEDKGSLQLSLFNNKSLSCLILNSDIDRLYFSNIQNCESLNTMILKGMTAPQTDFGYTDSWPVQGMVIVPTGAIGYDVWEQQLPAGWSVHYVDDIEGECERVVSALKEK